MPANALVVGPGKKFATLVDAVNASHDGDTIAVVAGTYTNDFPKFLTTNVTIVGVGGMVHEVATREPDNQKGFLAVEKGLTIKNFEFSGATDGTGSGNVAGIRLDAGNLSVQYCYFHDNQDGILGGASGGVVTIDHSEFAHNGAGDGFSHNIYIGPVVSLTVTNSYFHDAVVGHELKTRAMKTTIMNSVLADGPSGTASYDIDIPNAGVALIAGNTIEKGPKASNPAAIHYGGETQNLYASNSLSIANNVIIDDYGASATAVLNQSSMNGLTVSAVLDSNALYGFSNIVTGGLGSVSSSNSIFPTTANAPAVNTSSPWMGAPVIPIPQ